MKKTLIILSAILLCAIQTKAQNPLAGKTYRAEISASCKEILYADGRIGGCMIYTYRVLAFEQDSVCITYKVEAFCTPEELNAGYETMSDHLKATYRWSVRDNRVTIHGFGDYGKLTIDGNRLIGKKERNYKEFVPLYYIEITENESKGTTFFPKKKFHILQNMEFLNITAVLSFHKFPCFISRLHNINSCGQVRNVDCRCCC